MDLISLSLSKNYTNLVALGITNISINPDTSEATFTINETGDTVTVNLLEKYTLSQELVSSTNIGSVSVGDTYPVGTKLEEIIRDILTTYQGAKVTVVLSPATELYDAVNDSLSSIGITAKVTKGTNDVESVTFYVNGIEVNEVTSGVENGGNTSYTYNFTNPTSSTFTVKVNVSDGQTTTTASKDVVFVPKSYYGTIEKAITTPTEDDIKNAGFSVLKNTQKLTWENIDCQDAKLVYAYPKQFSALSSIKDGMDFPYLDSYTESTVTVDGYEYRCYLLNIEMTCDSSEKFKQVFA